MTRYVAFLRAVNVGKRSVSMGRLRDELTALGLADVSTYINSGNVVFGATGRENDLRLAIEGRLQEAFGFEIPTFLRTATALRRTVELRPFGTISAGDTHLVLFMHRPLAAAVARKAEALSNERDTLQAHGRELHWLIHGKQMDSTLTPRDWRVLGDAQTTGRRSTMLTKLVERL